MSTSGKSCTNGEKGAGDLDKIQKKAFFSQETVPRELDILLNSSGYAPRTLSIVQVEQCCQA